MGLIIPRTPLTYPGGLPRFNPGHIAAPGTASSGVAVNGGGFMPLFVQQGEPSLPTISGTPPTVIDGVVGRAVAFTGSQRNTLGCTIGTTSATFAAIFRVNSLTAGTARVVQSDGSDGFGINTSGNMTVVFGNSSITTTIPLTAGQAYFAAVSMIGGVRYACVAVNLSTGQIRSATATTGDGMGGAGAFYIGSNSGSASSLSSIATAMASSAFLALPQLLEWAQAPWDYWYPPTVRQMLFSVGGKSVQTYNQTVSPSTTSALAALKSVGKHEAISTISTLSALKQAGKYEVISTTSALTFARALAKTAAISTTSALTAAKSVAHAAAISTTSTLTAVKGVAHKLAISTTSALALATSFISHATTTYTQAVTISTSSALTAVKRAGKMIWGLANRVTQDGFLRVTQDGNQRVVEAAGFSSTSSMTLSKVAALGRTVAISTTSALSFAKAVTKTLTISTSSTVTVVRKIFASVFITITTSSAVTVAKGILKGAISFTSPVTITTSSALGVLKNVHIFRTITTSSALTAIKAVSKAITIATTSAAAFVATKAQTVIITVASSSALSLRKAVSKTIAIQTSSALALGKAFGQIVTISSTSTLSITKAVAKIIAITTSSVVQLTLGYVYTVLLTIATATASTVVISWTLTRVCLVLITTISSVLVNAIHFGLAVGREVINLVGRWAHMLLYGQVSQLVLAGQMSHMELGMSTNVNGVFHAGETWIINGLARDDFGKPLNLAGAIVQLRLVNGATIVLDLATPSGGVIVSPAAGTYQFLITPTMQFAANMTLTAYEYELRVELSNGTISVQNTGEITVKPSKFAA